MEYQKSGLALILKRRSGMSDSTSAVEHKIKALTHLVEVFYVSVY